MRISSCTRSLLPASVRGASTRYPDTVLAIRTAIQLYELRAISMAPTVDTFACITPTGGDILQK